MGYKHARRLTVVIENEKFRDISPSEKQKSLKKMFELSDMDLKNLNTGGLDLEIANKLIENGIGIYGLPLGIATNFKINGTDYLIPMVTEEPSIIAAASKAAKIFKEFGGITTSSDEPIATGQIQLILRKGQNASQVAEIVKGNENRIIENTNKNIPRLVERGGGVKNIETRIIEDKNGNRQVIVHLYINTKDAMGANITNAVCENIAPLIAKETQTKIGLKILSNLADKRIARANVLLDLPKNLSGKIVDAQTFAENDIYRAATHNKGIFNGIDAVAIATGNDWRAIEAGGHAYAARNGHYSPLTSWRIENGKLNGRIELPIQVGIVGGLTKLHPVAKISLKILGVDSSKELSEIMAVVGLAQNFAALFALVTTGIQEGHMKLHKKKSLIYPG